MYQLVFSGELVPGTDPQDVRANAMALFKATLDQVDQMFSGQRVVLRNHLDEETAIKYLAILRKHGMLCEKVAMPEGSMPQARMSGTAAQSAPEPVAAVPEKSASEAPVASPVVKTTTGIKTEPGDRLPVAGEKVDQILAASQLTLDPVGIRLGEIHEVVAPVFEHLDEISIAPVGVILAPPKQAAPPQVPDVSHLKLVD